MIIYVGYGFHVNDIQSDAWYSLIKRYDSALYEELLENDASVDEAEWFIDENSMSRCEYLRDIINENEKPLAGTGYVVSSYDDYLVFDSIRFADDSPRVKYIPNQKAFVQMISKYIPIDNVKFGNVYEGNEWIDPSFFMD